MSPIEFILCLAAVVVLVSWALFGRKPAKVKAETDCECGGCSVVRKASQPIEGAHGVYDPRPTQMGFTERQRLHDREVKEFRAELEKRGAA